MNSLMSRRNLELIRCRLNQATTLIVWLAIIQTGINLFILLSSLYLYGQLHDSNQRPMGSLPKEPKTNVKIASGINTPSQVKTLEKTHSYKLGEHKINLEYIMDLPEPPTNIPIKG